MEINLRIATDDDAQLWDQIVDSSPQGTLFHSWKWLNIAEKHTNTKLYPLFGVKGETVIGIIPIFHMTRYGMSAAFSPPPSTDIPYLGPVIRDYESYNQSKKESIEKEFQRSVDHFIFSHLKCGYSLLLLTTYHDPRPYKWSDYTLYPIFDYHLDINQDIASVWQKMSGNLKSDIKRTEKHGISIHDGSEKDLIDIYQELIRRYKEQNKPVTTTLDYFTDLYKAFSPDNFKIFVAKDNGESVGGLISILYKNRVLYWVGGAKPAISNFSPNDLAQWEAIKYAHSKDYKIYEEIGAGTERLARFKAKYNPRLVCRFSVKKYSSPAYKILEKGYSTTIKKVIGKLV